MSAIMRLIYTRRREDVLTLPSVERGLEQDDNDNNDSQGQVGNSRRRVSQGSP